MTIIYDPRQHHQYRCKCGAIIELTQNEYEDLLYNGKGLCPCCKSILHTNAIPLNYKPNI